MRRRIALFLFLLFGIASTCRAADSVLVKIKQFGLEGVFVANGGIVFVQVELRNTSTNAIPLILSVSELNLEADATPESEIFKIALTLTPGETRTANVPLHIFQNGVPIIYAEASDTQGRPLGRAGRPVGGQTNGTLIAVICANSDVCRALRQSILLTGSDEEQTRKSQNLRILQLADPPSESWAYPRGTRIIVASPLSGLSAQQRLALELFLQSGGSLALVEDQLADGPVLLPGPPSPPPSLERAKDLAGSRFLGVYRALATEGKPLSVAEGNFIHFRSVSSPAFAEYFRPLGFSEATPEAVRLRANTSGNVALTPSPGDEESWLMKRLGTTFRFPTFLELVLWIAAYLILVGVVNFLILRRLGRPEWGWITIPVLSILFSGLLYAVSARSHPSNFGLDEIVIYRMDPHSPLASMQAQVRISAPSRSTAHPILPAGLVLENGQRVFTVGDVVVPAPAGELVDQISLGDTWETQFPLRRWSFRDLNFGGHRVFAGAIYRDSVGRFHNDSGIHFQQAMVVDHEDVFQLADFPPGSVVDLGHVQRLPYVQETGRIIRNTRGYPGPPFAFKPTSVWPVSEEQIRGFEKEREALAQKPFSVLELIRGWSPVGDDVFYDTKAVFFGFGTEGTLGANLQDRSPNHKAYSLVIVTYKDWP